MRRRRLLQAGWHNSNRFEQRLNKTAGLLGIQFDGVMVCDQPLGHFPCMGDDKGGHGPAFQRGRTAEQLLVRPAHASDEALFTVFFGGNWHGGNVCLSGTHFNIGLF